MSTGLSMGLSTMISGGSTGKSLIGTIISGRSGGDGAMVTGNGSSSSDKSRMSPGSVGMCVGAQA